MIYKLFYSSELRKTQKKLFKKSFFFKQEKKILASWRFANQSGTQVGFAEFNNTADNRANIGGTIIGAPIVGQ